MADSIFHNPHEFNPQPQGGGSRGNGAVAIAKPWRSKCGGKFIHEFCAEKPVRNWLVKGVILAFTLFLIVGEPGCGKSFLALDMCLTMAMAVVDDRHSLKWFGRKIKPIGIVYIAAEGQEDFVIRIHAWMRSKGLDPVQTRIPVFLIPTSIDMRTGDEQTKSLMDDVRHVNVLCKEQFGCTIGLVVVDTLNRALAGGNDANPEHVGAFIRNCKVLQETLGVAVAAVAHTPKPGAGKARMDPRGHGSIRGDNDAELYVTSAAEGRPNCWKVNRNKAGPEGDLHEFRLYPIDVGMDEDNEPIQSCYVVPGAAEMSNELLEMRDAAAQTTTGKRMMTSDGRSILPDNVTMILRALHEAIEREGIDAPPDVRAPHGRRVVKMSAWTEELLRTMPGDDRGSDKFKDRVRKARDVASVKMRNRGIIGMDQDFVWRTSKRVAMIDRAENSEQTAARSEIVEQNSSGRTFSSEIDF